MSSSVNSRREIKYFLVNELELAMWFSIVDLSRKQYCWKLQQKLQITCLNIYGIFVNVHFLHTSLPQFLENLGNVCGETANNSKRYKDNEGRYQGTCGIKLMAVISWTLKCNVPDSKHSYFNKANWRQECGRSG